MAVQVSVIGSGAAWEAAAEEIGRLLAERGCTVVTGGLGEVMSAAHRGAKAVGGTTLAILSLCVDVARWFNVNGTRTPEEVGELYADLVLRMVGAPK